MFAEGWVVYPRPRGSPEPTWHEARSASCQVGSGDPLVLGYTTQPSANILIFKVYEFSFILFIHHNIHFYFELCTYCNNLDINILWNINSVNYLLFYMKLLNYLFCNMFGSVFGVLRVNWCRLAEDKEGLVFNPSDCCLVKGNKVPSPCVFCDHTTGGQCSKNLKQPCTLLLEESVTWKIMTSVKAKIWKLLVNL